MDYAEIQGLIGLSRVDDERARDVLDGLVSLWDDVLFREGIRGKEVYVFGCGPSLKEDFFRVVGGRADEDVLISVDGSIRLFMGESILPNFHVTDLDGDIPSTIKANCEGVVTVVHAHGDNIAKLKDVVPELEGTVFGTTQVEPSKNVKNFGGFTDGDRAIYLAEHYKPKTIYLAGMDFGEEIGEYSGTFDPIRKKKKLYIGKKLLTELAGKTDVPIVNLTSGGVELENIPLK